MKHFLIRHSLIRKFMVMFGIIGLFILGKYVPLPHVSLENYIKVNSDMTTMTGLTGGDLTQIGLFSLGLGPSMYGMLLSQLFLMGKRSQATSTKVMEWRKNSLIAIIALIQGLSLAVSLLQPRTPEEIFKAIHITIVLIAGAFVIDWLGSINSGYGIGGSMVIIVTNILLGQFRAFPLILKLWQTGEQIPVVLAVFWVLMTVYLIVSLEYSEYRIPIQRISIHNDYAKGSYMPIKANIAGGMPLMYAYTFLVFPQYIIMLFQYIFPNWEFGKTLATYFTTNHLVGVLLYLIIIGVLTMSLAYVNLDAQSIAEALRNSGDYIPFVRPGKDTQDCIRYYVGFFGAFNACFLMLLSGIPMLVTLGHPTLQPLSNFTGIFMMFTGMILTISEQIRVIKLQKRYQSIF